MDKAIRILVTGGTIGNLEYSSQEKHPAGEGKIPILRMLKRGRATVNYKLKVLMQKDSKFITDEDREKIYQNCINADESRIIITHGTMTMVQTAKYIGRKKLDKTVVLVGSIILGNNKNSDAPFNLGASIIAVQLLPIGVYVVMNGRIFMWDNVVKDVKLARFAEKNG